MPKIFLDIVSPVRREFSQEVDMIIAPGADGYLGILPNHIPLVTSLQTGILRVFNEGEEMLFAVSEGYMEVTGKKIIILVEAVEAARDIDVERALESKRRAEERLLNRHETEINFARAKKSLQRALNRLKLAERTKEKP